MSKSNVSYEQVVSEVIRCGERILKDHRRGLRILKKINEGDATNLDLYVEKSLMKVIKKHFPKSEILSEELCYFKYRGEYRSFQNSSDLWLIDPIDGTNNLINGIPYFCIALSHQVNGKTIFGCVYHVSQREIYLASSRRKSYLLEVGKNSKKFSLSKRKRTSIYSGGLAKAVVATCHFNHKKPALHKVDLQRLSLISQKTRSVRKMGSAALDLCLCAGGKLDGFWQQGLRPWDISAAAYICERAGLKVTNINGRPFDAFDGSILVGHSSIHRQILQLMS